jgi:putative hydrolase
MSIPFGFAPGGGDENNELADMLENMGRMLRNGGNANSGSVNWESARSAANTVLAAATDPAVTSSQSDAIRAAADLADLWLNDATAFPSSGNSVELISRTEWLNTTFDSWKVIVEPVAEGVSSAMTGLMPSGDMSGTLDIPEEFLAGLPDEVAANLRETLASTDFAALAEPLMSMAKTMGANMYGAQFGQALGSMASEVLSNSDIGFPLKSDGKPGLVFSNVSEFTKGLSVEISDALIYVVLRELAHQRLFTAAPWIQSQLLAAVNDFARGVRIDTAQIEQAIAQIDPNNPDSIGEMMSANLFEPTQTPEQTAALARIELLLALIEGWVSNVVSVAVANRLPASVALAEVFRRRRAAGGPAEKLFSGLIGLEMRPRRMREAATLWERLESTSGVTGRDALWAHPDLLPRNEDIDDIENFIAQGNLDLMSELNKVIEAGSIEDPEAPKES